MLGKSLTVEVRCALWIQATNTSDYCDYLLPPRKVPSSSLKSFIAVGFVELGAVHAFECPAYGIPQADWELPENVHPSKTTLTVQPAPSDIKAQYHTLA